GASQPAPATPRVLHAESTNRSSVTSTVATGVAGLLAPDAPFLHRLPAVARPHPRIRAPPGTTSRPCPGSAFDHRREPAMGHHHAAHHTTVPIHTGNSDTAVATDHPEPARRIAPTADAGG